jgi:hypothetical protein
MLTFLMPFVGHSTLVVEDDVYKNIKNYKNGQNN